MNKLINSLILFNGNIITMNQSQPFCQAIVIHQSKILFVGSNDEAKKYKIKETSFIDLKGKTVLPGLIESHGHLIGLGRMKQQLQLKGYKSVAEIVAVLKNHLKNSESQLKTNNSSIKSWIIGRGWDQNDWDQPLFPDHQPLTQTSPDHPICFTRVDGHAYWVNQRALDLAEINRQTPDPIGGKIVKDHLGYPTGILIDKAMDLIDHKMPARHLNQERAALKLGIEECFQNGITSFHDACSPRQSLSLYDELNKENLLKLRIYSMIDGSQTNLVDELLHEESLIPQNDYVKVKSIKLFSDGALGSCGAALHEEYCHQPGNHGLLLLTEEEIFETTKRALRKQMQVCTHAIGDKANTMVLNAYEKALMESQQYCQHSSPRLRVEHAELISPNDIPRFAQNGIIASIQATHCTSDMVWIENRLGRKRAKEKASVWRALLDSGAIIANGSDAPIESLNPFHGIYSSITRQDHHGNPPEGWNPEQRMSRMEALNSFTLHGAYAGFNESSTGSLQRGKLADLIVIDGDILTISPQEILKLNVMMTLVGGEIVFEK